MEDICIFMYIFGFIVIYGPTNLPNITHAQIKNAYELGPERMTGQPSRTFILLAIKRGMEVFPDMGGPPNHPYSSMFRRIFHCKPSIQIIKCVPPFQETSLYIYIQYIYIYHISATYLINPSFFLMGPGGISEDARDCQPSSWGARQLGGASGVSWLSIGKIGEKALGCLKMIWWNLTYHDIPWYSIIIKSYIYIYTQSMLYDCFTISNLKWGFTQKNVWCFIVFESKGSIECMAIRKIT